MDYRALGVLDRGDIIRVVNCMMPEHCFTSLILVWCRVQLVHESITQIH